jgi:hypothetical protein
MRTRARSSAFGAATLLPLVSVAALAGQARLDPKTLTQDELFSHTTVWNAHLSFTPGEWKAIEPTIRPPSGKPAATGEWLHGNPGERNGWRTVQFGIHFTFAHADLTFEGMPFKDIAARYKGSATYSPRSIAAGKNSLKLDLNKFVKGQKLAGVSTLNFHNAIADPSWLNEVLAYRLYRDAGVPAPRTAYVRVHLTVPGTYDRRYSGLYVLVENIDSNFVRARFPTDEGAVLKPVSVNLFSDLGDVWDDRYHQTYDPKTDLTDAEKARIIAFCRLVTHATDADFSARIAGFVDLDQFSRYFAVVAWLNNWDSILDRGQNFYMWLNPATGKFLFIPWDQDHSFGYFGAQPSGSHTTGDVRKPWPNHVRFLERMMAVPALRAMYLDRMREFSRTIFQPARFSAEVAELAPILRPLARLDPPKPAGTQRFVAMDPMEAFETIVAGKAGLLPFTIERARNVQQQLGQ